MSADAPCVAPMQHHGYRLDTLTTEYAYGFLNPAGDPGGVGHPVRCPVLLRFPEHQVEIRLGWVEFDAAGHQRDARLDNLQQALDLRLLPDDPRVLSFLARYPQKLPTLACVPAQRDCPLQLPFGGGVILIPGNVEPI